MYTRFYTCINTINTPNTPLNTLHTPYMPYLRLKQPIYALKQPIKVQRPPRKKKNSRFDKLLEGETKSFVVKAVINRDIQVNRFRIK